MHKQWIPGFPFLCPPKNLFMRLDYPLVHAAWPGPSGHEALTWPPVLEWLTLGLTWLFRTWVWPDLLLCLLWWLEPDLPCCIKNGSPNNGRPPTHPKLIFLNIWTLRTDFSENGHSIWTPYEKIEPYGTYFSEGIWKIWIPLIVCDLRNKMFYIAN